MAFTEAQLADISLLLEIGDDSFTSTQGFARTGSGWMLKDIEIPPS